MVTSDWVTRLGELTPTLSMSKGVTRLLTILYYSSTGTTPPDGRSTLSFVARDHGWRQLAHQRPGSTVIGIQLSACFARRCSKAQWGGGHGE